MLRAATLLAILFASAVGAAAQDSVFEPPPLERFLRWGPLRVRPGLEVRNFGYDDNVFYRYADDPRGPSEGDWTITLGPKIDGVVLFGSRAFLTFRSRLDYTAYQSFTEVNYYNTYNDARVTVPFKRLGVFAEAGYDRVRDRPIDAQDTRPIRTDRSAGVGGIVRIGWRTEAELAWTRDDWTGEDDSDPTFALRLDRTETGTRFRIRYLLVGRTRLIFEGRRLDIEFDDPGTAATRNGTSDRWLPGVSFGEGGPLAGTFRAGPARIDLVRGSGIEYDDWVGEAKLVYRPGRRTTFALDWSRDAVYSVLDFSDLYLYRRTELQAVRWLNSFLGVEGRVRVGSVDYLLDPGGRVDDLFDWSAGMRFRVGETSIGRRVEYSLTWNDFTRDSNDDRFDSRRRVVGFGAVLGY